MMVLFYEILVVKLMQIWIDRLFVELKIKVGRYKLKTYSFLVGLTYS